MRDKEVVARVRTKQTRESGGRSRNEAVSDDRNSFGRRAESQARHHAYFGAADLRQQIKRVIAVRLVDFERAPDRRDFSSPTPLCHAPARPRNRLTPQ